MSRIRVLVVDDSAFMRKVISDIISRQLDMEVVGTASNGMEALDAIKEIKPDVVTMDVEMPVLNGLEALPVIMKEEPLPVIMLSRLTQSGADATLKALQEGAFDFVPKPSGSNSLDINMVATELVGKIRAAAGTGRKLQMLAWPQRKDRVVPPVKKAAVSSKLERIVLIGTSTGGPRALYEVIPQLPGDLAAAVLVVQHMPPGFTKSLAERLNSVSSLTVKEAENGEQIKPSYVYIAPGDYHMKVKRAVVASTNNLNINLTQEKAVSGHRPSVDVMIESVVSEFWSHMVGVIMTGMGQDGARGVMGIKSKGGKVIAQDQGTCIVYGMPKAVVQAGNADAVVGLGQIAKEIVYFLKPGGDLL
ncbi:MAG: protein-glutamate methylesterase/protein-glutamine glutaminase [Chitinophagales bacterium]